MLVDLPQCKGPISLAEHREALYAILVRRKLQERIAHIDRLAAEGKLPPVPPLSSPFDFK